MGKYIVQVRDVGRYGMVSDRDYSSQKMPLGAWTSVEGWHMRGDYAEKWEGLVKKSSGAVAVVKVLSTVSTVFPRFVCATNTKLYETGTSENEVLNNITRQTASVDVDYNADNTVRWTGGIFEGVTYISNPYDTPQMWDARTGTGLRAADLTAWPSGWRVRGTLRHFKNFLVAVNVYDGSSENRRLVKWSHSGPASGGVPTSWDHTDATKDAGQTPLAGSPSPLVDSLTLGDSQVIYSGNDCWAMRHIGAPAIFGFFPLFNHVGLLGKDCAVEFEGKHFVVTADDVVVHDGRSIESVVSQSFRRALFGTWINKKYSAYSFVCAKPSSTEIYFFFPYSSASEWCDLVAIWNWRLNCWTLKPAIDATGAAMYKPGDTLRVADTQPSVKTVTPGEIIVPSDDSYLYRLLDANSGTDQSLVSFAGHMERNGLCPAARGHEIVQDPTTMKMVTGIRVLTKGEPASNLTVKVGAHDYPDIPPTYPAAGIGTWTPNTTQKLDLYSGPGRFISVRFENTGTSRNWGIVGYDLEMVELGKL